MSTLVSIIEKILEVISCDDNKEERVTPCCILIDFRLYVIMVDIIDYSIRIFQREVHYEQNKQSVWDVVSFGGDIS